MLPHASLLSYDTATALILLLGKDQAVLVDVSLCVDPSSSWVRERLGVLMIIGHIENSSVSSRRTACLVILLTFHPLQGATANPDNACLCSCAGNRSATCISRNTGDTG
jgi:hypothetical protein